MDIHGYTLILPNQGQTPSIQKITTEIRKTYESIKVSKFTPKETEKDTKFSRYEEFMIKADVNFGKIGNNSLMKENIIRRFCQENVLSGIGESWLYLNVIEIGALVHETQPKLNAFALGSIVHMNTFVEHYSSLWSKSDKVCKITVPTVHFRHDIRKLEINFNVAKQNVISKSSYTHLLHMLELDYNMILRILVEITKEENLKSKSGIRFARLYLVMSGAPLIKVRELDNPDEDENNGEENKEEQSNENLFENAESCKKSEVQECHTGKSSPRGGFGKSSQRGGLGKTSQRGGNGKNSQRGNYGEKSARGGFKNQSFEKNTQNNGQIFEVRNADMEGNGSNSRDKYVSPSIVDQKMKYCRAAQFGMEKTSSFCSSKVFGKCRVLRLDLQSPQEKEGEVWDTITQLVACCCEAQVFFTSMTQRELKNEFSNPSVKSNFSCLYALNTVISPSFSVTDEINLKYKLHDVNQKLNEYAKESPEALEKSLFEIQTKHEKGDVIRFVNALDSLYKQNKCYFEKIEARKGLPQNVVLLRRVLVTPTRTVYLPPIAHMLSFLLRETKPEFALRATIRDDNCDQLTFTISGTPKKKQEFLNNTIGQRLMKGFKIGDREYRFFGSSTSQLREHGSLFYAKDCDGNTAESIRDSLGDFSEITIVAKYMARMGQSLSQALYHLDLPKKFVETIPDVEIKHKKCPGFEYSGKVYTFSDGIGQMSPELADKCYKVMGLTDDDYKPCAIQIRYAGSKGMLLYNPKLKGVKMILRKSMCKFESDNISLEILKPSCPQPAYLNRPFITILEQMGVKKSVFFKLQANHLRQIISSLHDSESAVQLLHEESVLRLPFKRLHQCGVNLAFEPFFRPMIMALYSSTIGVLKSKARIKLPFLEARTMFGVMDETRTLEYGQVFVQYTTDKMDGKPSKTTKVLEGEILITKNPCMHPGDVRKFTAVYVKDLMHVKDCVVFPQKGPRPHPDEMAGSDLDGDEYCIVWYKPLIFERENHNAMDYSNNTEPKKVENIQVKDMVSFMCDYIRDDYVGLIASAHLAWADTEGIFSERCMELARKYSVTLDFAKTGEPEELSSKERVHNYPDFTEKFREKDSYLSTSVLGHLHRNCKSVEIVANVLSSEVNVVVNEGILYEGWEQFHNNAQYALLEYIHLFSTPTRLFHLTNEGEIMSGAVKKLEKTFQGKNIEKNIAKMLETVIPYVTKKMKTEFYKEFLKHEGSKIIISNRKSDKTDIDKLQDHVFEIFKLVSVGGQFEITALLKLMLQKASAWYATAYRSKQEGSSLFLGLPWVVPELMGILHARNGYTSCLELKIKSLLEDKEALQNILGETPSADPVNLSKQVMQKWAKEMGSMLNFNKADLKYLGRNLTSEINTIVSSIDVLSVTAENLISKCLTSIADSSAVIQFDADIGREFWQKKKLGIFAIVALSTVTSTGMLWETEQNNPQSSFFVGLKFLTKEYREEIRFPLEKREKNRNKTTGPTKFAQIMKENTSDVANLFQTFSKVGLIKIDFKETKVADMWYVLLSVYGKPFNIECLKDAIVQPSFESKVIQAVNECCIM